MIAAPLDERARRRHKRRGCVAKFAAGCEWPRHRADQAATWNSSAMKVAWARGPSAFSVQPGCAG